MTTGLRSERAGRVLVLTIDRPEVRNALDPATLDAIAAALTDAALDDAIGAVVLTGAGHDSFSSGMDLRALEHDRAEAARASRAFDVVMRDGDRIPIVAAVAGNAIGGGFEIALRCDLVVAADDVVFGLPEVGRGLVPGGGGTLLPSRISLAVALELGLTGEPITVQRAYDLGLVNRVVPRGDVLVHRDRGRGPHRRERAGRGRGDAPADVGHRDRRRSRRPHRVARSTTERGARPRSRGRACGVLREARAALGPRHRRHVSPATRVRIVPG